MTNKGTADFPAQSAVTGVGHPRKRFCDLRFYLRANRNEIFTVCLVHNTVFG